MGAAVLYCWRRLAPGVQNAGLDLVRLAFWAFLVRADLLQALLLVWAPYGHRAWLQQPGRRLQPLPGRQRAHRAQTLQNPARSALRERRGQGLGHC